MSAIVWEVCWMTYMKYIFICITEYYIYIKYTHYIYTYMYSFTHQNISMRLKEKKYKIFNIMKELGP